ncbi:MAG: DUF3575 domain-containing protein [Rikenellaceae bacterium]
MRRACITLSLLMLCLYAYGQTEQKSESLEIYFERNKTAIDPNFGSNKSTLDDLSSLVTKLNSDTLLSLSKVEVDSYASPEGGVTYNNKLTAKRSHSLYTHLTQTLSIPDSLIFSKSSGVDWSGLRSGVAASNMEYRDEVLDVIDRVPEESWERVKPDDEWLTMVDSRNKHLMDLGGGRPFNYMFEHIYPKLRRGSVVTIYFQTTAPSIAKEEVVEMPFIHKEQIVTTEPTPITDTADSNFKPLLAIKTNLLFDALTAINLEFEVPLKKCWSIAAEWIFPWWTSCGSSRNDWHSDSDSSRNTFQLLHGNIEGKYWFGNRDSRPVMTGWHLGIYAGGGLYDMERKADGYQGEFFIAAGLSGGYAHTIFADKITNGNLRMEYSLGVGYLKTNYQHYTEHWGIDNTWHTVHDYSGNYTWFGPTRARVSLVWLFFNRNAK